MPDGGSVLIPLEVPFNDKDDVTRADVVAVDFLELVDVDVMIEVGICKVDGVVILLMFPILAFFVVVPIVSADVVVWPGNVLFVIFWPDFKDGSFFSALGKINELPVYSLIALTALFTALIAFVASILINKLKPFGVPLLLISTALWEFVMVLGLIEDNINGISLALTICPLVIAFLAVYFWRKGE